MKGKISVFAVLFFLFVAVVSLAQEIVNAPEYQEGDAWSIKYERNTATSRSNVLPSGTYKVIFKDGEFHWYDDKGEEAAVGVLQEVPIFHGNYAMEPFYKAESPTEHFNFPFYEFPLKVGKRTPFDYFNRRVGRRGTQMKVTPTVKTATPIKIAEKEFMGYEHELVQFGGNLTRTFVYTYVQKCKCSPIYTSDGTTAKVLDFKVN